MSDYQFTSALGYSFDQLAEQITASFAGYFFPMSMTPAGAADFWRVNQVDASRSVVMRGTSGTLVGMAWVAARGTRGYCASFGIVPDFRGRGAGKLLAEEMVRRARESGLEHLQIEVLTQNTPAIHLYEGVGFRSRRRLIGMELVTDALPPVPPIPVADAPIETLLPALASQRPCWGHELPSLLAMRLDAVVSRAPGSAVAGLLVQRTGTRVLARATALPETTTPAEFAGWLRAVAGDARTLAIHNEDESSLVVSYCREMGFRETFSQHEMSMAL